MIHASLPWDYEEDDKNWLHHNVCKFPDCGRGITDGATFCQEHAQQFRRFSERLIAAANAARPAGIAPEVWASWVRDFR